MASPTVTVVVPVKDRRERMLRCLDALLALDYPHYDVLVLDNCSTDGTADACRKRAQAAPVPLRVEVLEGTVGHLRNLAARMTTSEVLAYTDSDCMPQPGWLRAGVEPFADPAVGVVQGTTLPDPDARREPWDATIEVTEYTRHFESCNLLVRREALAAAEGFHEVVGHFWEDTAAGWSLLRTGWRPAFVRDAVVHHDVTYPGFAWWLRRGQRYGNSAAVIARYPELRRELLFAQVFLRPRDAKLLAAVAGLALGLHDRRALLLALPYLAERGPRAVSRYTLGEGFVKNVAFDLSTVAGCVRGSIRHRALVL